MNKLERIKAIKEELAILEEEFLKEGESNPDPEKWSVWSEVALIIAESKEIALELDGRGNTEACEISLNDRKILIQINEPDFGDDL